MRLIDSQRSPSAVDSCTDYGDQCLNLPAFAELSQLARAVLVLLEDMSTVKFNDLYHVTGVEVAVHKASRRFCLDDTHISRGRLLFYPVPTILPTFLFTVYNTTTSIMAAPFSLKVTGNAVIPHPAERAVINVAVESSGQNKATVSDEVLTTAKHLETLLRQMAPSDRTPEAKQASPLAHWSKTGLTATSHIPWVNSPFGIGNTAPEQQPRQYDASITFVSLVGGIPNV